MRVRFFWPLFVHRKDGSDAEPRCAMRTLQP
jgi:hypothetical protein